MRIGIDTYSYHRLLGALRPGEAPATRTLPNGGPAAIRLSVDLGADVISVQTCFLDPAHAVVVETLGEAAGGHELIIAWGAPNGLAYGNARGALDDAMAWIDHAATLGSRLIRIVLGGPSLRGREETCVRRNKVVPQLRVLAERASEFGAAVAVENHGDITATDLLATIKVADHPALGVCFDTANAVRVGDDPVDAARLLHDYVRMVHLKDIEPLDNVNDPVAGPRSVPYGEGVVPLVEVLHVLGDPIDHGAAVCVELGQIGSDDEIADVCAGVKWLRQFSVRGRTG